ncbi:hypothetical protein KUTeg_010486 [Tegillarca granosa]|uniref:Spt4/RpoE2 zinc finger domain-containing protein n=1 Tax=Tegillarca granosa TaxID=220873 RepID=A0ABQ9F6Y8_TEGGR|nr:hypothetical protein KUTeg_010486 [Tegillarca granosa]
MYKGMTACGIMFKISTKQMFFKTPPETLKASSSLPQKVAISRTFTKLKTFEQFEFDGCDNCEEYLHLKNNRDGVYDCTSSNFDGVVALMSPDDSWVAKWQRICKFILFASLGKNTDCTIALFICLSVICARFVKGCYAISVTGRLPPGIQRDLKRKGIILALKTVEDLYGTVDQGHCLDIAPGSDRMYPAVFRQKTVLQF